MHKAIADERLACFEEESILAVWADWVLQKSILQIAAQLREWISFGYTHTLCIFPLHEHIGFFFSFFSFFLQWECLRQANFNVEAQTPASDDF